MAVQIFCGNLFESEAAALLLSTDLRMDARAFGGSNLVAAFQRRWPEAWEDAEADLLTQLKARDGVVLGDVLALDLDDQTCPFGYLLLANSLPHLGGDKPAAVSRAVEEALRAARRLGLDRIAAPVMVGGWRLTEIAAFDAMLVGVRQAAARVAPNPLGIDLDIYNLEEGVCERLAARLH